MEGEIKNSDAQIYTEARSYVVVDIFLEKPLVSKRPPEELAAKVGEQTHISTVATGVKNLRPVIN